MDGLEDVESYLGEASARAEVTGRGHAGEDRGRWRRSTAAAVLRCGGAVVARTTSISGRRESSLASQWGQKRVGQGSSTAR